MGQVMQLQAHNLRLAGHRPATAGVRQGGMEAEEKVEAGSMVRWQKEVLASVSAKRLQLQLDQQRTKIRSTTSCLCRFRRSPPCRLPGVCDAGTSATGSG